MEYKYKNILGIDRSKKRINWIMKRRKVLFIEEGIKRKKVGGGFGRIIIKILMLGISGRNLIIKGGGIECIWFRIVGILGRNLIDRRNIELVVVDWGLEKGKVELKIKIEGRIVEKENRGKRYGKFLRDIEEGKKEIKKMVGEMNIKEMVLKKDCNMLGVFIIKERRDEKKGR